MPNQEITVGLRFTADTTQAKQQLNALKTDLMNLGSFKNVDLSKGITEQLNQGSMAAARLKTQLEAATNVKTGNLDLSKFNKQLQMGGNSLSAYKNQLTAMGPAGQQAFLQLANSIQTAEIPLIRINSLFGGLWQSLKRTVGWQISSSAIHAFMGAIQGAYRYAQDLNESLNNIRIVTGKSIEDMSKFADQANKSAKALSTTTNEYAKASLIFYRQGLDGTNVTERANTVIKMANVTGESAESVSDYMTAVWNNFADGSATLESFADKMTALGATTASSTDEIAGGLEKFAAVSKSVGLSFDYAASALATITAITRQSEDTVGTALKTIFARLEGLKLGETLEDGTELNKYSSALLAVGVNIKDANGQLKDMDTILDELGMKWQTLEKDEKMALAQTVAGMRQYNQLIALMDNWGTFQKNLTTTSNSTGTLNKQAEIYAESWEAAQKRVKASAEAIYSDLINDKFFIDLTNYLAKILNFIDNLIKTMGGLPGLLSVISTLVLAIGKNSISNGIRNLTFDIENFVTKGAKLKQMQNEIVQMAQETAYQMMGEGKVGKAYADSYSSITKYKNQLTNLGEKINQIDRENIKNGITILENLHQQNIALQEKAKKLEETQQSSQEDAKEQIADLFSDNNVNIAEAQRKKINQIKQGYNLNINNNNKKIQDLELQKQNIENKGIAKWTEEDKAALNEIDNKIKALTDSTQKFKDSLQECDDQLKQLDSDDDPSYNFISSQIDGIDSLVEKRQRLVLVEQDEKQTITDINNLQEQLREIVANGEKDGLTEKDIQELEEYKNVSEQLTDSQKKLIESLVQVGGLEQKEAEQIAKSTNIHQALQNQRINANRQIRQNIAALEELADSEGMDEQAKQKLNSIIQELRSNTETFININHEASKSFLLTENAEKQLDAMFAQGAIRQQDWAMAITNGARTVSQLSMTINGAMGIVRTFNNPDLSGWEKFSSIMMTLPMVLGGIVPIIVKLISGYSSLAIAAGTYVVSSEALNIESLKRIATTKAEQDILKLLDNELVKNSIQQELNQLATDLNAQAKKRAAATTADEIKAIDAETSALKRNADARIKKILAEEADKRNGNGESIDTKGLNSGADKLFGRSIDKEKGSFGDVLSKNASKIKGGLMIAAGIAVIIAAITVSIKLFKKEAEEAEKSAKAAQQAQDAANEAAEKFNTLKETIKGYDEAVESMQTLVKGTKEFSEALEEANSKALELIKTVPGIQYHYDSNGLIQIDSDLEEIEKQYAQQSRQMNANALRMQAVAADKQAASDRKNFQRNVLTDTQDDILEDIGNILIATVTGAGSGALIGGGLGALGGPLAGITAGAGAFTGAITGLVSGITASSLLGNSSENENKGIDAVEKYYKTHPDLFAKYGVGTDHFDQQGLINELSTLEGVTDSVAKAMGKNAEQLEEFVQQEKAALEQRRALLKESANEQFQNINDYVKSDYKDYILNQATKSLVDTNSEAYQKIRREVKDLTWGYENELAKEYLAAMYGNNANNYRITDKAGTNWTVEKKNDDNVWNVVGEKNGLSQATVIDYVTETRLMEASQKQVSAWAKNADQAAQQLIKLGIGLTNTQKEQMLKEGKTDDDIKLAEQRYLEVRQNILAVTATGDVADLTSLTFSEIDALKDSVGKATDLNSEVKKTLTTSLEGAEQAKKQANIAATNNYFENRETIEAEDLQKTLKAVNMTADGFENYAKSIQAVNKEQNLTIEESRQIAKESIKTSSAVQTLSKIFEDNEKALSSFSETGELTAEQSQLFADISIALKDWLGVDFSESDIIEHFSKIKAAAEGDIEALKELNYIAAEKMVATFDIDEDSKQEFLDFIDYVNMNDDLKIGATLSMDGEEEFIEKLNEMVYNGRLTAEQTAEYLRRLGVEATPDHFEEVPAGETTSHTTGTMKIGADGEVQDFTADMTIKNTASVPVYDKSSFKYSGASSAPTSLPSQNSNKKSGSSSSKKAKTKFDEIDRYHEINKELETVQKNLDRIDKIKDRAFGSKHLAAINAEVKELEKYSELLDQKIAENQGYLKEDAGYALGVGAILDEHGHISNYNALIAQWVDEYNAGSIDDDAYSQRKAILDQYEKTLDEAEDLYDEKVEKAREILDKKFEGLEYAVEVNVRVNQTQLNQIQWQLSHLENRDFASADRMILRARQLPYLQGNAQLYQNNITQALMDAGASEQQISDFFSTGNIALLQNLNITNDIIDKIEEWRNGLKDIHDTLGDIAQEQLNELNRSQEEYDKKIDRGLSELEHYSNEYDHIQNIIELIGKKQLGISNELMQQLRAQSIENLKNIQESDEARLESQKAQLNELKKLQSKYYDEVGNLRDGLTEQEKDAAQQISNMIDDQTDKIMESTEKVQQDIENRLEAIKNHMEQIQNELIDDWFKSIAGPFESIDDWAESFDRKKTISELYLKDYKKIYELNKLNRNLNKDLDETNNVKNKQRIRDFQEEINQALLSGQQITEYDLQNYQKRYELLQAQMALEDARNAKMQVRLTRDASGNYSYVYTADEDDTQDKIQKLEDALYNLQDLNETTVSDMQSKIVQIMQEYMEALRNIGDLSTEEGQRKYAETVEYYTTLLEAYGVEADKALNNNLDLYQTDYQEFSNLIKNKGNLNDTFLANYKDFVTQYEDTILGKMLNDYNSFGDAVGQIVKTIGTFNDKETLLGKIYDNQNTWRIEVGKVLNLANNDLSTYGDKLKEILPEIKTDADNAAEAIKNLATDSTNAFSTLAGTFATFQGKVDGLISSLSTLLGLMNGGSGENPPPSDITFDEDGNLNIEQWKNANNLHNAKPISVPKTSGGGSEGGIEPGVPNKGIFDNNLEPDKIISTDSKYSYDDQYHWKNQKRRINGKISDEQIQKSIHRFEAEARCEILGNQRKIFYHCKICGYDTQPRLEQLIFKVKDSDDNQVGVFASKQEAEQYISSQELSNKSFKIIKEWQDRQAYKKQIEDLLGTITRFGGYERSSFATGGYTGEFGNEGRLATLHEKELVLNKTDTQNMLSAVQLVREISNTIDLQAKMAQMPQSITAPNLALAALDEQPILQDITINADFPGVSVSAEIEEAFNQLSLQASQYAYRNRV